jgi:hypothetical protein
MLFVPIDETALPHQRRLFFAGARCDLQTNSLGLARLLEALSVAEWRSDSSDFTMRVVVDETRGDSAGKPHFRGLHHVVIASFGESNIFVFDILRRTLSAHVSGAAARDYGFWKEKLIPISLGVLGAGMGLVPVHCACLEIDGHGLLIAGASGAGKSTLSVALAEAGFSYISDDWTYISEGADGIVAHGTSAPVKLLPDAVQHFRDLRRHSLKTSMNGELAYEVDIAQAFDFQTKRECAPRWLLFLERTESAEVEFTPMRSAEARNYVSSSVERLPAQLHEAAALRERTIELVGRLPCWRFRYGGTPQFAASQLMEFVVSRREEICA